MSHYFVGSLLDRKSSNLSGNGLAFHFVFSNSNFPVVGCFI